MCEGACACGRNLVASPVTHTRQHTQVLFVPTKAKTPALRAGTVDAANPYKFALPPQMVEQKVANISSGNYCQPRCDEPWTGERQAVTGLHRCSPRPLIGRCLGR
jgi:hypothetical protein